MGHSIVVKEEVAETSRLDRDDTARLHGESHGAMRLVSIVEMYCRVVSCLRVAACGAVLRKGRALKQCAYLMADLAVRRQNLESDEVGMTALNYLQVLIGWAVQSVACPGDLYFLYDAGLQATWIASVCGFAALVEVVIRMACDIDRLDDL